MNSLYGCAIPHKLHVDSFKWVEETYQFSKDFIEKDNEDISNERYFIEVYVRYPKKLYDLQNNLHLLHKIMKIGKLEKLIVNLNDMLYTKEI